MPEAECVLVATWVKSAVWKLPELFITVLEAPSSEFCTGCPDRVWHSAYHTIYLFVSEWPFLPWPSITAPNHSPSRPPIHAHFDPHNIPSAWPAWALNHGLLWLLFMVHLGPRFWPDLTCWTWASTRRFPSGSAFIKRDQPDPWIKDQIKTILLSTMSPLQLPNFVSCGRDKPSHMTQNLVTVGTKLWTAERFLVDPWSMDQADLVW